MALYRWSTKLAGIGSIPPSTQYMTQCCYDNLPSSKLTDWINRGIYTSDEDFTLEKFIKNWVEYCLGWWGWVKSWCIDILVVWWWGGGTTQYVSWWWWAWWFIECSWYVLNSLDVCYPVTVWCWWCSQFCTIIECKGSNWWDSCFHSIKACWWWSWKPRGCSTSTIGWWSWWGWDYCYQYNYPWLWIDWQWNKWWNWCLHYNWWWWGWAWTAWCNGSEASWGNWWAWKCSSISWELCRYAWGWGWGAWGTCTWWTWWCWWWWNWVNTCNTWCNATYYWWWWGWWDSRHWTWYQWVVILRYKTDWSCWIKNTSIGWCKYECWDYTIHCFTCVDFTECFIPVFK